MTGTNASQFVISNDNCSGVVLNAGVSCTLSVAMAPTVQGSMSASLDVSAAPGGTISSSLSGTAAVPPQLSVTPASLAYGPQVVRTFSAVQRITITNVGATTAGPIAFSLLGDGQDYQVSSTCSSGLVPGASCTMDVLFSPTSLGPRTATLRITALAFSADVTLSGTGI